MPFKLDRAQAGPATSKATEPHREQPARGSLRADGAGQPQPWTTITEETGRRLVRLVHILDSLLSEILEDRYLEETCGYPINRAQLTLLRLITVTPHLQVNEIAAYLGFSPAAASKNIDKLEQHGLLIRDPAPEDRRAKRLRPTTAGRELVIEHELLETDHLLPVLESLATPRVERLCQLLTDLCVGLAERLPAEYETCLRCAGHIAPDCPLARLHGGCSLRETHRIVGPGPGGTA